MAVNEVVFPFLVISSESEAISCGDWVRIDNASGEPEPVLESGIPHWSYDSVLELKRHVSIDIPQTLGQLALDDFDAQFLFTVVCQTSELAERSVCYREVMTGSGLKDLDISLSLDSRSLSDSITLISSLSLAVDLDGCPAWSPGAVGERLWEDKVKFDIEGSGSRFPMRAADFASSYLPADADWYLDWQPNLMHYSFNSAVSLLVNENNSEFIERLEQGDSVLVPALMGDIICEIVVSLLGDDDFLAEDAEFPDGSLGYVAKSWVEAAIPNQSLSLIRDSYLHNPSRITCRLRSLGKLI